MQRFDPLATLLWLEALQLANEAAAPWTPVWLRPDMELLIEVYLSAFEQMEVA